MAFWLDVASDAMHCTAHVYLLHRITTQRTYDLSARTYFLFWLSAVIRLPLLTSYRIDLYDALFTCVTLIASAFIMVQLRRPMQTAKSAFDAVPPAVVLTGAGVLAALFTPRYEWPAYLYTFALFVESMALLPQILAMQHADRRRPQALTPTYFTLIVWYGVFAIASQFLHLRAQFPMTPEMLIREILEDRFICGTMYLFVYGVLAHLYDDKIGGLNQKAEGKTD
ncbi:hypothetical protein CXG81DRAFT_26304 [Caulochytrium protostelioides]|uniref:ER lumen protein retaining receptor n=1 Tax=Caulochytrium protostelioides TaxID=1555241 RepID=A0A4P9X7H9_9FUNG|nr:hypothetical protein CXG81DRAFT_26304 [Caulochytrium protostelioides]|eukprot:RKP01000.1 hypothetical protein CXG81DRAFT_26304 [Caulochytrium protostelioides]